MSRSKYAEGDRALAQLIIAKIRRGEVPRPLTPEALLHEVLSCSTPFLNIREVPLREHRRLASAVFAFLAEAGIVRRAEKRSSTTAIRARLREMADAMPEAAVPQNPVGYRPDLDADEERPLEWDES